MNRFHIAIATSNVAETVRDYSSRLGAAPCSHVPGEFALWRTESLNLSIRHDATCANGELRHLGWEDASATSFSEDKDVNGIAWERFSAANQADEINRLWPEADYQPE